MREASVRGGEIPTEYRLRNHKSDRDRAKMVWSIFLRNGVAEGI